MNAAQCAGKEGEIGLYLAESILPGASVETLQAFLRVVQASSTRFTADGRPVRYLHSIFVPGDGLVIWLFEALDAIDIRDIYEANELPFTRIVEVIDLTPTTESSRSV